MRTVGDVNILADDTIVFDRDALAAGNNTVRANVHKAPDIEPWLKGLSSVLAECRKVSVPQNLGEVTDGDKLCSINHPRPTEHYVPAAPAQTTRWCVPQPILAEFLDTLGGEARIARAGRISQPLGQQHAQP